MRHQRLLARFSLLDLLLLSGFTSDAFSLIDPLSDLRLFGRDVDVANETFCASSRGAEVGAMVGDRFEERDENDCTDGESSVGVAGIGDPRPVPFERLTLDIRGLCTADGLGVPCVLYTPSVPNECGVE